MKTRVIVTLEDNNTMSVNVEGEAIGQVVIGMMRYGQLYAEQEIMLQMSLSRMNSPLISELANKIIGLISSAEIEKEAQ